MNLAKWLIAGKSVMDGRKSVSYRVDKQFYLPKFGPAKNPFTPQNEKTPIAPAAPTTPAAPRAPATPATPAIPAAPATPGTKSLWRRLIRGPQTAVQNGRVLPEHSHPGVQAQNAHPTPPPENQPELSLDRVKVVHNDLSDADVEVVPIKSRPAPPDLPPAKSTWELLGERLMRATAP